MFKKFFSLFFKKEVNVASVVAPKSYVYNINDPSTPALVENTALPAMGGLKYTVKNFTTTPKNKTEQQALNCYINLGNCINYVQRNAKTTIKNWAATSNLNIIPQAGKELNAYYDRSALRFFYYSSGLKTMYTADSCDVVSHELGHALLDAMRPDFWSVQSLEIWSFHEAFADICALVSVMQYDTILNNILQSTNNDISKSNSVSKLAEEFGVLVYSLGGSKTGSLQDCLRNPALEQFKYVDPKTLPKDGRDDQLLAECHSFGKVFTAAWYKILVEIYKLELARLKNPLSALKSARDICFISLVQAIPSSPRVVNYYDAVASSMINIAKIKYPTYWTVMNQVFIDWNMLAKPIKILSNTTYHDLVANLKRDDQVVKNSKFTTIRLVNNKTIKLNSLSILSDNKLNGVEIEVPSDEYYQFDSNGNLVDEVLYDEERTIESAQFCIQSVEKSLDKMWSVQDGKLVRNYMA
jgi:hypothetical protein